MDNALLSLLINISKELIRTRILPIALKDANTELETRSLFAVRTVKLESQDI